MFGKVMARVAGGMAATVLVFSVFGASSSLAATCGIYCYSFTYIGDPSAQELDVSSQFFVGVTAANGTTGDLTGNQALFTFYNDGPVASSIKEIYFDDDSLLGSITSFTGSSAGVQFSDPATPAELPGNGDATPDFITTSGLSADANPPPGLNGNGIDVGESLAILFTLVSGETLQDVIDAIVLGLTLASDDDATTGTLRMGLHVGSINGLGSDSFVNGDNCVSTPVGCNSQTVVPLPAALPLFLSGLGGMGLLGWRRRRKAAA